MKHFDFHGRSLSQIALGCNYFGTSISEEVSRALLDLYLEMGGNLIDTASVYSQTETDGPSESELLIGRWLKENGVRDELILVSKGCHPEVESWKSRINEEAMLSDVCRSLEQLQVDQLDIWFFHRDDLAMGADEIIDLGNLLIEQKLTRHIGASNWSSDRIAEANQWAASAGKTSFAISQIQWSLAHCTPEIWGDSTIVCMNEREHAWYTQEMLPVMSYSPQAKGLFSKLIADKNASLEKRGIARFASERNLELVPKVEEIATRLEVDPAAVVMAYLISQKNPTVAIAGASRVDQLRATLSSADLTLNAEELAFLS